MPKAKVITKRICLPRSAGKRITRHQIVCGSDVIRLPYHKYGFASKADAEAVCYWLNKER